MASMGSVDTNFRSVPSLARLTTVLSFFVVTVSALLILWLFYRVTFAVIPFDTDEADHANAALELYTAIRRADFSHIVSAISRQAFYPPLHSFFVTAAYFISAPTTASSRLPSVVLFAIYLFLMFSTAKFFFRRRAALSAGENHWGPLLAGSTALCLAGTSTITILNSILCMLEITGLVFTALLMAAFNRLGGDNRRQHALAQVAALTVCVTLSKYSFGIIVLPAVLSALFIETGADGQTRLNWSSPLYALSLVVLGVSGWLLLTEPRVVWHFIVGHPSNAPMLSTENLVFDVRAWIRIYSVNAAVSVLAIPFALYAAVRLWREPAIRLACFIFIWAVVILTVSTTNEERHFIVAAPPVWFLAAVGLALGVQKLAATRQLWALGLIALFYLPIGFGAIQRAAELHALTEREFEGQPEFAALQEFIVENVKAGQPIVVNGDSDRFSLETLRWLVAARSGLAYTEVKIDSYPFNRNKLENALKRKRNVGIAGMDNSFPRRPFSAVLESGYYKYAVQIKNLTRESRSRTEANDFADSLAGFAPETKTVGNRQVAVYNLSAGK